MLVSRFVYDGAVYGGLVAIVASAWVAIRQREREVEPKIPPATATRRPGRRYLARIAPAVTLIALLGGEWALLSHAYDAVVVDAGPTASRAVYIGDELGPGMPGWGNTLVFNRSEHGVTFVEIDYDDYQPRELAPGSVTRTPKIQYLGPDHQPPTDPAAEQRTWLTWD